MPRQQARGPVPLALWDSCLLHKLSANAQHPSTWQPAQGAVPAQPDFKAGSQGAWWDHGSTAQPTSPYPTWLTSHRSKSQSLSSTSSAPAPHVTRGYHRGSSGSKHFHHSESSGQHQGRRGGGSRSEGKKLAFHPRGALRTGGLCPAGSRWVSRLGFLYSPHIRHVLTCPPPLVSPQEIHPRVGRGARSYRGEAPLGWAGAHGAGRGAGQAAILWRL